MKKEDTYHGALVDAIQTIDSKMYMKFDPEWARLRKIIDLVLRHCKRLLKDLLETC